MKKFTLAFALLFSTAAHAVDVMRYESGYMFRWVENGVLHCWGMPDLADLNYFPTSWMKVTDVAIQYSWPAMHVEPANLCLQGKMYRSQAGWMYSINQFLKAYAIQQIPAGIPCGDKITNFELVRSVTYNGLTGFAVCF